MWSGNCGQSDRGAWMGDIWCLRMLRYGISIRATLGGRTDLDFGPDMRRRPHVVLPAFFDGFRDLEKSASCARLRSVHDAVQWAPAIFSRNPEQPLFIAGTDERPSRSRMDSWDRGTMGDYLM